MKGKSKEETMKKVKGLPSAALPRCKDNAAYELESALAEHKALAPIAKYGGALGRDLDRLADSCCRCAAAFIECAQNLRANAAEARENGAP